MTPIERARIAVDKAVAESVLETDRNAAHGTALPIYRKVAVPIVAEQIEAAQNQIEKEQYIVLCQLSRLAVKLYGNDSCWLEAGAGGVAVSFNLCMSYDGNRHTRPVPASYIYLFDFLEAK
jgi:hypothetical protein